uniref:Peptidase S1 domain-containing protein n=1 Tax=Timema monikensis TaxID=170555 RepID=A0A7R9E7N0_9NEOP|nr:unnamed protein product [Timema monikensis]
MRDKILNQISRVNEQLQHKDMAMDRAVNHLTGLKDALQDIRDTGIDVILDEASSTCAATSLEIDCFFEEKRAKKRKRLTLEERTGSSIQQHVSVPVVSNSFCAQVYQQKRRPIERGQICAGGDQGKDSCRGDSGGPLMAGESLQRNTENVNGRWFVMGVVSYGPDPCGKLGWPGVYTRVSEYMPWILDQLQS